MSVTGRAVTRGDEHVALASGQRRRTTGEPFRGRVLHHEPERARLHRAAQISGTPEGREDEHAGGGRLGGDRRRGRETVEEGHLDVEASDLEAVVE